MDHPLVRPREHVERSEGPCLVVVVDCTTGRHLHKRSRQKGE